MDIVHKLLKFSEKELNKKNTLQITAYNLLGTNSKFKGVYSATDIARVMKLTMIYQATRDVPLIWEEATSELLNEGLVVAW